jgi:diacylglycerol kinase family enzyme
MPATPIDATHGHALARPSRAALLVNPAAGSAPSDHDGVDRLIEALNAAGYDILQPVRWDLGIDSQLAAALDARPEIVFVIGGDGTIRAVAEGVVGRDIVLGILPGGTMNRVAARLGLSGDPLVAARSLSDAVTVPFPAGTLNGRVFLYQAVAGRTSRLVRFREMQRGVGLAGWLPLLRAALRWVVRPPRRSLRLRDGARALRADVVVVTLPLPDAEPAFQVDAVRRGGLLTGLRQGWRWMRGRLATDEGVVSFARPHLAVQGMDRGLRVTLDGEQHLLSPPLRFQLRPDALHVLRPRRE